MEIVFIRELPRIICRSLTEAPDEKFIDPNGSSRRRDSQRREDGIHELTKALLLTKSFHDSDQLFRESFFFLSDVCTYGESGSVGSDGVKSTRSLLCNERFTSEIRMARRKNISGVSMIVLLIPRATLSADENCKLPVTIFRVRYVCRQTCVYTRTHTEKELGVA